MTPLAFPSCEDGFAFHRRLLDANDLAVSNDLCERYLDPLCDWLAGRFRSAHADDCCTAAIDALMTHVKDPAKYDPAKLDLGAYLHMAAGRDLSNLRRKEARHQRLRVADFRVEESRLVGNYLQEEPSIVLLRREAQASARRIVGAVRAECSEPERAVLELLIDGERASMRYAVALGVEQLPKKEMRHEVKKVKDRLEKRIGRKGEANDDPTREDGREGTA